MTKKLRRLCALALSAVCLTAATAMSAGAASWEQDPVLFQQLSFSTGPLGGPPVPQTIRTDVPDFAL